jgi:hypothetical protein
MSESQILPTARGLIVSAVFLLLLVACAGDGVQVSTTFDPLEPFPPRATFRWDMDESLPPVDPRLAEIDYGSIVHEVVSEELAARGYTETTGSASYGLSYELRVHSWFGPDQSRSIGTLSLEMENEASGRRVWTGFGRAEVHINLSREERKARLREAVTKMLRDFPPGRDGE